MGVLIRSRKSHDVSLVSEKGIVSGNCYPQAVLQFLEGMLHLFRFRSCTFSTNLKSVKVI